MTLRALWRYLVCLAVALGVTLAADSVFLLRRYEMLLFLLLTFLAVYILLRMLEWSATGIRGFISGARRIHYASHFFVWVVILAIAYWLSTEVFTKIDRYCAVGGWLYWYCF